MPRPLSPLSKQIIIALSERGPMMLHQIYESFSKSDGKKKVYDTLFRLQSQELINLENDRYHITDEAGILLHTINKKRDGIWKIIIFDIPESKRQVRNVLRSKLISLGFEKWQNSIWVSPYILAKEIEDELNELAKHYFIRLIKTSDINDTTDLEALFIE